MNDPVPGKVFPKKSVYHSMLVRYIAEENDGEPLRAVIVGEQQAKYGRGVRFQPPGDQIYTMRLQSPSGEQEPEDYCRRWEGAPRQVLLLISASGSTADGSWSLSFEEVNGSTGEVRPAETRTEGRPAPAPPRGAAGDRSFPWQSIGHRHTEALRVARAVLVAGECDLDPLTPYEREDLVLRTAAQLMTAQGANFNSYGTWIPFAQNGARQGDESPAGSAPGNGVDRATSAQIEEIEGLLLVAPLSANEHNDMQLLLSSGKLSRTAADTAIRRLEKKIEDAAGEDE